MKQVEFQNKVSRAKKPVVVDFWAAWCGPCMVTKPILEKLAKEYAATVEFIPINADESQEILSQYGIFGIPTIVAIRGGEEAGRITGTQNEAGYRQFFQSLSEGRPVNIPMSPFNRMLRLGAGALFILTGISTGNWIVAGVGCILAFMGIYDRCPIWRMFTGMFRRR